MKLAIGTAQFGLDYGVSNTSGRVALPEIKKILSSAKENNITILDTSTQYGESEKYIGEACDQGNLIFNIITKTSNFHTMETKSSLLKLRNDLYDSLKNLKTDELYGLLFHNADDLLNASSDELYLEAVKLKNAGYVKKIGVSVYTPSQLDSINNKYPIDIVQLPMSIFDQRFLSGTLLTRLKEQGVEIHVRSTFLQGLLLMPMQEIPEHFSHWQHHIQKYYQFLAEKKLSQVAACLNFCVHQPSVDHVVCGVTSSNELIEICKSIHKEMDLQGWSSLSSDDEALLLPMRWAL